MFLVKFWSLLEWFKARPASRALRESHRCRKRGKYIFCWKVGTSRLLLRRPMDFFKWIFVVCVWEDQEHITFSTSSFLFPTVRWPIFCHVGNFHTYHFCWAKKKHQFLRLRFVSSFEWVLPGSSFQNLLQETFRSGWSRPPQVSWRIVGRGGFYRPH